MALSSHILKFILFGIKMYFLDNSEVELFQCVCLTSSIRDPPGPGGSWQPADVRTPPGPGGSLYAAVFASVMIKLSGLLHPFIS